MVRRWIIRICFMLPILLCVGGWACGETHEGSIVYCCRVDRVATCVTSCGIVYLGSGRWAGERNGWAFRVNPVDPARFWTDADSGHYFFLGFGHCHVELTPTIY